ncbi:MAG: hypothetical protein WB868_08255 [Xanthobacteraceae bacterium]
MPNQPWQYTTIVDLIDHWQALIAGALGFAAAVVAVILTLRIERRKLQREMDALQKSLAIELRQHVGNALVAGNALKGLARGGHRITARMVESLVQVPAPIVYPASAAKIGLLGQDAMDLVIVYSLIEIGRSAATRLITSSRAPDDISAETVEATGTAFLFACAYAQSVLPKLRTGVVEHDQKDAELIRRINEARSS